jgi:hypothetical protein
MRWPSDGGDDDEICVHAPSQPDNVIGSQERSRLHATICDGSLDLFKRHESKDVAGCQPALKNPPSLLPQSVEGIGQLTQFFFFGQLTRHRLHCRQAGNVHVERDGENGDTETVGHSDVLVRS